MKIYTKTGDKGKSSLFGGKRVSKDDKRLEAYGTIDELNSLIGVAVAESGRKEIKNILQEIQNELFIVGSDLATPLDKKIKNFNLPRVTSEFTKQLEEQIDDLNSKIPELKSFILPGGTKVSSVIHLSRTICRRAERRVVTLSKNEKINNQIIIYLNRLSDFLFVLARFENFINDTHDINWKSYSNK